MAVVVVESPAKAKTIARYLGPGFTVLASYGHVRDLPAKDGSVDPADGFAMRWEVAPEARRHLKAIADALKADPKLVLATDPDREGEAISWHIAEVLRERQALKAETAVERVVFNAVTKAAVTEALRNPRAIDAPLVSAYLARRALDYLVGFTLSPVLWRKLPGARSAGRVQSVCLRLVVEREMEIEAFRPREYWTIRAELETPRGERFGAKLVRLDGKKLDRFDLASAAAAHVAKAAVEKATLKVATVDARPTTRTPPPPFITSTLQQEASRKLGLGPKACMAAAQRLYEAGLITYMRTDGLDMAPEAIAATRAEIMCRFGQNYLPVAPRIYKNKVRNAQEAHECIRPTDIGLEPGALSVSDPDQRRLYELIWKRTLACQMEAARFERTTVEIADETGALGLKASGQVLLFDGFLKLYDEGRDERTEPEGGPDSEESTARLPVMKPGETLRTEAVVPEQHFTEPPPRYTEAALVKRMEELGIGRPSTYATILSTLEYRGYVRKEKNRLIPEDKGRLVTAFLVTYFPRYVDYAFTATLEEQLDEIADGERDWRAVLAEFWLDFSKAVAATSGLRIGEVLEKIDEVLAPHLYPPRPDGADPRLCPACQKGRLHLKTARAGGAFIGCSAYPECRYTRPLALTDEAEAELFGEGRLLGYHEGKPVTLRTGRFGPYVQLGEATPEIPKPPRASLPKGWTPETIDLERAIKLLSLPRTVGVHPDDGEPIETGIGRFGPYLRHGATFVTLHEIEEVFTLGINRAVELLADKRKGQGARRRSGGQSLLRSLGEHPKGGSIAVMSGRYGPYVQWGKVNASLPKDKDPASVTLAEALALLEEKTAKKDEKGHKEAKRAKPATDEAEAHAEALASQAAPTTPKSAARRARARKK